MSNLAENFQNEPEFSNIDISLISAQVGFNPRKFFDPVKLQELADSIKAQGVVQPIVVRPRDDGKNGYFIVAGERRYRASKMADKSEIPSVVREISYQEAKKLALIENIQRDDMSIIEEAIEARKILDVCNGDLKEAASTLGWSVKVLNSRLKLLHATENVQNALIERRILLGHCEYLSILPEKMQEGVLEQVIKEKWSIAYLGEKVRAYTDQRKLQDALFCKKACVGCDHNTSSTADLFSETVGDGYCTDADCWNAKHMAYINEQKSELTATYPVVFTDLEKDPNSYTVLVRTGNQGVGGIQFDACQSCKDFGVVMDTRAGNEGKIREDDVCFNLECHKEKVSAYKSETGEKPAQNEEQSEAGNTNKPKSASTKKTGKAKKASTSGSPKGIQKAINKIHRHAAATVANKDGKMVKVHAIISMYKEAASISQSNELKNLLHTNNVKADNFNRTKFISTLYCLDDVVLDEIMACLTSQIIEENDFNELPSGKYQDAVKTIIQTLDIQLPEHYCLDMEFMKLHTKTALEQLLLNAENKNGQTFVEFYNDINGDDAFKKLFKRKTDEIHKLIENTKFDFSGYIPDSMAVK